MGTRQPKPHSASASFKADRAANTITKKIRNGAPKNGAHGNGDDMDGKVRAGSLKASNGLGARRYFTHPGENAYDQLEWTRRSSLIAEPDGRVIFKMDEVEVPTTWSQLATDILASKYFRRAGVKNPVTGELGSETSARQVVDRIAISFRKFGEERGYFASREDAQTFEDELRYLLITQRAAFNSPVWFNVGHWHYHNIMKDGDNWVWDLTKDDVYQETNYYARPQGAACFIQRCEDTINGEMGIMELVAKEARLFKGGSGCVAGPASVFIEGEGFLPIASLFERFQSAGRPVHDFDGKGRYINIDDLNLRTLSIDPETGSYRLDRVDQVWNYDVASEDKLRVKFDHGAEATTSAWHPFLVWDGEQVVERRADQLRRGDAVIGVNSTALDALPTKDHKVEFTSQFHGRTDTHSIDLDEEIAWLVGYFIGDGSLDVGRRSTRNAYGTRYEYRRSRVRFFDETVTVLQRVQDIVQRRFGEQASINEDGRGSRGRHLTFAGRVTCGFFATFAAPGPKVPKLPSWIWTARSRVARSFLAGLVDSDGHVTPKASAKFSTASRAFARAVATLASFHGFGGGVTATQGTYTVTVLHASTPAATKQEFGSLLSHPGRRYDLVRERESWGRNFVAPLAPSWHAKAFVAPEKAAQWLALPVGNQVFHMGRLQYSGVVNPVKMMAALDASETSTEELLGLRRIMESIRFVTEVSTPIEESLFFDLTVATNNNYLAGEKGLVAIHNTGTNFSRVRGRDEPLSSGGKSSGLLSFLKILDANAGSVKSGGTTRRAAKMVIVDVDHPDIEEFVTWKASEEKKAKILLEAGIGLDSQGRPDFNGEAYQTVSGQNSNNSVRVTDAFMKAVKEDKDWTLVPRTGKGTPKVIKARELWNKVNQAAWECADPGVQYDDTIQKWHTCKNTDRIYATNPCAEFVFLDETSCNLASVNLMKFFDDAMGFDIDAYRHACRIMFIAQEIGVDLFSYPSKTIAEMTHKTRPLGLGYANLGTLLMCMGMPYNGAEGRAIAAAITALMHGEAFLTSVEMAKVKGPFALYEENRQPFLEVMSMHREAAYRVQATGSPIPEVLPGARPEKWFGPIIDAACQIWDRVLEEGKKSGFRNAQATVLAPTGTIGLLMDCDTTGVEPEFSLVKWKKLAGGGYFQIINQSVPRALRNLGYSDKEVSEIEAYVIGRKDAAGKIVESGKETVEGAPQLKEDHYAVFECANRCGDGTRFIPPEGHLNMMGAVQPFLSGAISKTVNLPSDVTVEDIGTTYELGGRLGLKAVALYRDGCKASQPLSAKKVAAQTETVAAKPAEPTGPKWGELVRLPKFSDNLVKREITVMDQRLGSVKVHVMFREDPRGRLMEIFLTVGKNGSSIHELCRDLGIAWSKQLRLGLSCKELALDLLNENGSVAGMTDHPLIKTCVSVKDLIGKLILYEYQGVTDFLNPEVLDSYRKSLDYVPPRHQVVSELNELRALKETRKEKPLTIYVDATPLVDAVDPNELAAKFNGDAPDCDVCGFKTVRNAACYKCLNCGNSMGCS